MKDDAFFILTAVLLVAVGLTVGFGSRWLLHELGVPAWAY